MRILLLVVVFVVFVVLIGWHAKLVIAGTKAARTNPFKPGDVRGNTVKAAGMTACGGESGEGEEWK